MARQNRKPLILLLFAASMVTLAAHNPANAQSRDSHLGPVSSAVLKSIAASADVKDDWQVLSVLAVIGIWRKFRSAMVLFFAGLKSIPEDLTQNRHMCALSRGGAN